MTATFERLGRLLRALGAATILTGLLGGLPYVLLHYAQAFRPDRVPTLGEITVWASNPLDEFLILQLLYCVSWVLWAYLILETLRELCWYAAHFGTLLHQAGPDAVAFTARRTITGLLVGAIVLAIATSLRSTSAYRSTASLASWSSPISATAPADPTTVAARTYRAVPTPTADRTQVPPTCTVRPGDTLWDLADRHLDNPLRWKEIYELNKMRPQPDGGYLSDPDRIYPGWTMLLPTASPAPTTTPAPPSTPDVPPTNATAAPAPTPSNAAVNAETVSPAIGSGSDHSPEPAQGKAAAQTESDPGIQLPRGAGYLAVTVATALSAAAVRRTLRRRRDYQPGDPASQHQPRPEETPLVAAMRGITRHHPGAATEAGSSRGDLPFATRGRRQHGLLELLADQQHPMLTLAGPGADDAARALIATALTIPMSTRLLLPRTDAMRLAPGLADGQLTPSHLTADFEEALGVLEEELLRRVRHQQDAPSAAGPQRSEPLVLLARHNPHHHHRLRALVKAGGAHGLAAVLLADMTPTPADGLVYRAEMDGAATAIGTVHGEALRIFHLPMQSAEILLSLIPESNAVPPGNQDGPVNPTSPALANTEKCAPGGHVDQNIDSATSVISGQPLVSQDSPAETEKAASPESPENGVYESVHNQPATSGASTSQSDGLRRPEPAPEMAATPTPVAVAIRPERCPVSVTMLGPLAVTVHGRVVTRGLGGYAGELLAYLASHLAGSTKDAILEAIWPEKDPGSSGTEAFHTAKKSVRGALRTALGATNSVSVFLHVGGLWRLDPALIEVDLDAFHNAVRRAAAATDVAERLAAYRRAVDLYHGELCEGLDRAWLTAPREEARRRTLNALGTLATNSDDPEEAVGFLERALEHDPYNEQLHLRLAHLHSTLGRADAVRRTQERLYRCLAEIDERPTAATTRAFQELLSPTPALAHATRGATSHQRPDPAFRSRQTRP